MKTLAALLFKPERSEQIISMRSSHPVKFKCTYSLHLHLQSTITLPSTPIPAVNTWTWSLHNPYLCLQSTPIYLKSAYIIYTCNLLPSTLTVTLASHTYICSQKKDSLLLENALPLHKHNTNPALLVKDVKGSLQSIVGKHHHRYHHYLWGNSTNHEAPHKNAAGANINNPNDSSSANEIKIGNTISICISIHTVSIKVLNSENLWHHGLEGWGIENATILPWYNGSQFMQIHT